MKVGHQKKFVVLFKQASSLHSLISDGLYRPTSLGRNRWKSLIGSEASLQPNCNQEGFNTTGATAIPHTPSEQRELVYLETTKMTA